jgi:hypothetical protein
VPSSAFLKSIIDELGNGPIGPRQLQPAPARAAVRGTRQGFDERPRLSAIEDRPSKKSNQNVINLTHGMRHSSHHPFGPGQPQSRR